MNKLPFKERHLEGFLMLVGFVTLFVVTLLIISWLMATAISVIMSVASLVTFQAIQSSITTGVFAFVIGLVVVEIYEGIRLKREMADKLEGMDDYEARKEVWEEMIKEEQDQEQKDRELELEGDKL